MDEEYPEYAVTAELGNKGRRMVETQVHEALGWLFRDVSRDDLGIDGLVEVVDPNRESRGRTFAVQIKCGHSFFSEETSEGYIYRGSFNHLNYWLEHSLPVVLVLCNPDSRICYWIPIEPQYVERHQKGWSVVVPKSKTLTVECKHDLMNVVARPLADDVIPLALYRLVMEKFPGVKIAQVLEIPRDFYYFTELARHDGKILLITYIYKPTRKLDVADLDEVIEGRAQCITGCGWDSHPMSEEVRTVIFLVAHTARELELSPEVKAWLAESKDVDLYRVTCNFRFGVSLHEVTDDGGLVQLYDQRTGAPETFGWKAS
ncbi:DUF4365 domain-containing protein [Bradyrhizobium roseum]|uniref:DUF4365 domain-containing protein n=1 Tax=Bradyrhizobium roseum TaxID=3056648 RepID=UPI002603F9DB|nr:DUF4365 domain-containing protein [Bradyrhizobium roseus]WKA31334.1 DUF4365 domain-containing protein [Bradyrhizobium roseus]